MRTLRDAVGDIYLQVQAPAWAAPNLDGLADVLRDLSWLPPGPVPVHVPAVAGQDLTRLVALLGGVELETANLPHPVWVIVG
ncbi:hypothetical protein [uncultured Jatrophihabitans sp.]|uniref:barstar family protein n=1 Tax=uncultured Jatrophihabitans sp. TaxID=1610747 RepID=UPI0035C99069